ncbi:LCP family protein [Lipingzhangella sp. LS1_29]|uniref:LCP family protein n=1 Tax=Lipingzhangella rawalii TaxID=2055835 RepID=A0ABU2H348_9ACTN|nr:LCP family protein [Lipingzhangella rawalii]MDS1269726.1 LCP family protein [Lipingzhangella rawalii]
MATTGAVIASGLTAYGLYHDLYGNITQEAIDTDSFEDRPSQIEGSMNVLIIGSDERTGENSEYGDAEGERPDTLIIAHVTPEQETATLVNIPRDSVVELQACAASDDRPGMDAGRNMIGLALTLGGPPCLWNNVEQLTGLHIDHYIHMDFHGFSDMVDALGGVEMCIPEPISDEKAHLELDAGQQVLDGEEALGFVRARYALGDGSDTSRIERQQQFMGAMAEQASSSEVIANPGNLYDFLSAVTQSITTDDEFSPDTMADLAIGMREVDMSDIEFVTVPHGEAPDNPNRIIWREPDAQELFDSVRQDSPLTDPEEDEADTDDSSNGGDDGGDAPDVAPEEVTVEVLNGTGVSGLAGQTAEELRALGFTVADTGNPQGTAPQATTVLHSPDRAQHARALADALSTASVVEDATLGTSVQLVLADDWDGVTGTADTHGESAQEEDAADAADGASGHDADTRTAADDAEFVC